VKEGFACRSQGITSSDTDPLVPTCLVFDKHRNSRHTIRAFHRSLVNQGTEVSHIQHLFSALSRLDNRRSTRREIRMVFIVSMTAITTPNIRRRRP